MSIQEAVIAEPATADPKAEVFSLDGTPVLSAGRYDKVLTTTDFLTVRAKVYAEGGENATHTHRNEDHIFFVLAGQATFHLGRDGAETSVVNAYEGIMLPKGAFYRFESSGNENLVLFRVGAQYNDDRDRIGPDGKPLPGHSAANNHVEGVPVEGMFFTGR